MIFSPQTPAMNRPSATFNMPTNKTQGSKEIESIFEALSKNQFVTPAVEQSHPLSPTWERLEALYDLEDNWNGYDIPAPMPDAIENAKNWIECLYRDTKNGNYSWFSPHVSADEDGHIAFEWARGRKRLAIYVAPKEAWYIQAWGPSVTNEMGVTHLG